MRTGAFLIALLFATSAAAQQAAPLEENFKAGYMVDEADVPQFVDSMVPMIRDKGWKCDSVSRLAAMILETGFWIWCNHRTDAYYFTRGSDGHVQVSRECDPC